LFCRRLTQRETKTCYPKEKKKQGPVPAARAGQPHLVGGGVNGLFRGTGAAAASGWEKELAEKDQYLSELTENRRI